MNQEPISRRAAPADAREGIPRLRVREDVNAPPDCEPSWRDDWDLDPPDPRIHDLRGQHHHGEPLTEDELRAITDITINRREYL